MSDIPPNPPPQKGATKKSREARIAQALRDNLKRRKAAQRKIKNSKNS